MADGESQCLKKRYTMVVNAGCNRLRLDLILLGLTWLLPQVISDAQVSKLTGRPAEKDVTWLSICNCSSLLSPSPSLHVVSPHHVAIFTYFGTCELCSRTCSSQMCKGERWCDALRTVTRSVRPVRWGASTGRQLKSVEQSANFWWSVP